MKTISFSLPMKIDDFALPGKNKIDREIVRGQIEHMKEPISSKNEYEKWLNELEVPFHDCKSNGGRIRDNAKYGSWIRRNDPIAFQVGYNEWARQ